ncbi:putative glycosyl hydrolase 17 family protein [Lyophyllum shimeji]|uniref:glucan endo-1,3-beta-D-glucosidase n=1 Tax=Lyophyllum shimeji TaxID=47721 RepID=A0A9P3PPM5_LYOSH|nr:putative glycosyl hydrolase 17 family protein [Lyophyllum shimeji]
MAYYRDQPQPSSDIQRYYDDAPGQAMPQHAGFQAQNPFDSTQHIPLTAAGPRSAQGGPMYTQAATQSTADFAGAANQNYKAGDWMEASKSSNKRSKWVVIGSIVALMGLIAIGVVVGIVVSKNAKKSNSNSGNSKPGSPAVNQTDPNDPSTFVKNPNLHQSLYGLAYTPQGSQLPDCGAQLSDVIQDVQLMSQLTTRIRLYGADCNQSALVLEAIKQTKVNMKVWLGNYAIATDNGAAYQRQRDIIKSAIQTYGTDHIGGVTVGNEFMLNYLNANGGTVPDSSIGDAGAAILISNIQDTRNMLTSLNVNLPVGTSDAGSYFNTKVLSSVDYGMANVHPWFANVSEADAAAWTAQFFQETNLDAAAALPNKPKMYIAETGWPTKSSDAGNAHNGPGTASEAGLQTFLNTFVCQANTNGTGYFFFEYFDEPWKDVQFGGVEGWWGLFTANRTLKHITIPDCPAP